MNKNAIPSTETQKNARRFQDDIGDIVSEDLLSCLYSVIDGVYANVVSHQPGYQISDLYIWNNVLRMEKDLIPKLSKEYQDLWKSIRDFLWENVGVDVVAEQNRVKSQDALLDEMRVKHNLITYWSVRKGGQPFDLNELVPAGWKSVAYTVESANGHTGSLPIPANTTYLELWKMTDELVRKSEDTHHVFIEGFIPQGLTGGVYVSLGS